MCVPRRVNGHLLEPVAHCVALTAVLSVVSVLLSYVCLGELAAWFVGWNLTLEYMISAAVIARTWSSNLMLFINQIGGNYPKWLSSTEVEWGVISELSPMSAVICLLCTGILLMGVKESARFNMFITIVNICVILFVIGLGSFHVHTDNWTSPRNDEGPRTYFPMGINGVLTGAATVFFSYIGTCTRPTTTRHRGVWDGPHEGR